MMTDSELIKFCGLADWTPELQAKFIATLAPERRELFEKMREVELWDHGFGPKPEGVIVCHEHQPKKRKAER